MSIQQYSASSLAFLDAPVLDRADHIRHRNRFLICSAIFLALAAWAYFWPQTGDGDAINHFLNAQGGLWQPRILMGSFARVGMKIFLLVPAQFGIFAARCASALISVICAWQTMRLADDLGLNRAILAGPLLIFQPLVFELAGDTMTELPFALAMVIAVRLWWARRWTLSCLVVAWSSLVRPEGFFLCVLWGILLLFDGRIGTFRRRIALGPLLGCGVLVWTIACWIFTKDPLYWKHAWFWPTDPTIHWYNHGSFFAHFMRWPVFCGPILFVLFLIGCAPILTNRFWQIWAALLLIAVITLPRYRENVLVFLTFPLIISMAWAWRHEKIALLWIIFLMIFMLHSTLWWGGWFGSCGLMRILACVSPVTAVICLRGWNNVSDWLALRGASLAARRSLATAAWIGIFVGAIINYTQIPTHYRIFPLHAACDYIRSNNLLKGAPKLIIGDPMAIADLKLPPNVSDLMYVDSDRTIQCKFLLEVPIGSVGLWDNQHAREWFNVDISDLPGLGFVVLHEERKAVSCPLFRFFTGKPVLEMSYVVIRKAAAGEMPAN